MLRHELSAHNDIFRVYELNRALARFWELGKNWSEREKKKLVISPSAVELFNPVPFACPIPYFRDAR